MKNQTMPLIYGIVILIIINAVGSGSTFADDRKMQDLNDSLYLHSNKMKWPVPLNEIKYDEFRRKVGLFLCNKFNVSPDKAFLDPRFQSIYYDESPLVCDYSIVESDRRLIDNVGNAIGAYFYDIQRILKVGYKVGEYQIEMMVDTDGYVSKASIIKDTFKDNALKSLMLDMFMGLYFMPIGGTMQAKLVISVTAKANTEKQ